MNDIEEKLTFLKKYVTNNAYKKIGKKVLNDEGYYKAEQLAEQLEAPRFKFYRMHKCLATRIKFGNRFYYKEI